MGSIDKMATDGTFDNLSKRERLQIHRQRAKLEKNLGSISDLSRLPAALFIVDVSKEQIAVKEARRLSIPVFGMVDTNSDPNMVDFPIPANDDASNSISIIIDVVTKAIEEGLNERKSEREKEGDETEPGKPEKTKARKTGLRSKLNDLEPDEVDLTVVPKAKLEKGEPRKVAKKVKKDE
jgi:small subunit ribosomal protein S2